MDTFEGYQQDPESLHRYLYTRADPANLLDPTGHDDIGELMTAAAINVTLTTLSNVLITGVFLGSTGANPSFDAGLITVHGNESGNGWTLEGGIDFLYQFSTQRWFYSLDAAIGTNPLGTLPQSAVGRGPGFAVGLGPVLNMSRVDDLAGASVGAVWPVRILPLLQAAMFNGNKAWGVLSQFAKNVHNVEWSHASVGFGVSSSGASFAEFYLRSNIFSSMASVNGNFYPVSGGIQPMFDDLRARLSSAFSVVENGTLSSGSAMIQGADQVAAALASR